MNRKHCTACRLLALLLWALVFSGLAACGDLASVDCSYYTDPVCGIDGSTYQNGCYAGLAGVAESLPGECPYSPCTGPVCGDDGTTYPSDCFAALSGVETWEEGACG